MSNNSYVDISNTKYDPVEGFHVSQGDQVGNWSCQVGYEEKKPFYLGQYKFPDMKGILGLMGTVQDIQELCNGSQFAYLSHSNYMGESQRTCLVYEQLLNFTHLSDNTRIPVFVTLKMFDHTNIACISLNEGGKLGKSAGNYDIKLESVAGTSFQSFMTQKPLMQMDEKMFNNSNHVGPNSTLFRKEPHIFICTKRNVPFVGTIRFSIELDNGTITSDGIQECSDSDQSCHGIDIRNLKEGNCVFTHSNYFGTWAVSYYLRCNLGTNARRVHCYSTLITSLLPEVYLSIKKEFRVQYYYAPEIDRANLETNVTFILGNSYQLHCKTVDIYSTLKFSWEYLLLESEGWLGPLREQLEVNNSILEFSQVTPRQAGIYRCKVQNRVGTDSIDFNVIVITNPVPNNTVTHTYSGLDLYPAIFIGLGVLLVVIIPLVFVILLLIRRFRIQKALLRSLTDDEVDTFFNGKEFASIQGEDTHLLDLRPYRHEYEIDLDDTDFDYAVVFGTGEFAYVVKAKIRSTCAFVAVKVCKPTADVTRFKAMLAEIKIMIHVGQHQNIVSIIGACTKEIRNRNVYIFMELCENGSLEKFLRVHKSKFTNSMDSNGKLETCQPESNSDFNTFTLIRWALEIATGMEYVASKSIVHADLAARNVLLDVHKVAKISDFGLSKNLYESDLYIRKTKTPLPWRHMAPESLKTLTFSTKSDVYTYGISLWEIFTLGEVPFANEVWTLHFVQRLMNGFKLTKPEFSTDQIYQRMTSCWEILGEDRPSFSDLRVYFTNLVDSFTPVTEGKLLVVEGTFRNNCSPQYQNQKQSLQPQYQNQDQSLQSRYVNEPSVV